jgi:hypothetical protein
MICRISDTCLNTKIEHGLFYALSIPFKYETTAVDAFWLLGPVARINTDWFALSLRRTTAACRVAHIQGPS